MNTKLRDAKYFFSPTLLDAFIGYLNAEADWDKYYGEKDVTDDGYVSIADYEQKVYDELIAKINREPHAPFYAAERGTAFNDIVDTFIHQKMCGSTKMEKIYDAQSNVIGIRATRGEFVFDFDIALCNSAAVYFGATARMADGTFINTEPSDKCLSQVLVESIIETEYGAVNLYGFIDEMRGDVVYDIKTTSKYEFGKYKNYNQRFVYPYCLIESGLMDSVRMFEFTAYKLAGGTSKTPMITGTRYSESYDYNHNEASRYIKNICERFIEFIEANREKITDKNIFTWHEHKH